MSRRQSINATSGGVNLGLIVTPMLDMSFQLLAFFIMVYSPATGEEFIGANVTKKKAAPDVAKAGPGPVKGPGGDDKEFELERTLTIILSVDDPRLKGGAAPPRPKRLDGADTGGIEPKFMMVRSPGTVLDKGAAKDGSNLLDMEAIRSDPKKKDPFKELKKVLDDIYVDMYGKKEGGVAGAGAKKDDAGLVTKFRIEAESDIQFAFVIQVYAVCKKAGFDDVDFASP
jgi:biopolymer transport protein ExbD